MFCLNGLTLDNCLKLFVLLQVRAMQRPPPGVKMVIEAVCIMKGIKPKKVAGEKVLMCLFVSKVVMFKLLWVKGHQI